MNLFYLNPNLKTLEELFFPLVIFFAFSTSQHVQLQFDARTVLGAVSRTVLSIDIARHCICVTF